MSAARPNQSLNVVELAEVDARDFARSVAEGLRSKPKRLDCRFFYDAEGSRLFEEICELPEYYPTRAELEILESRAGEIAARFRDGTTVVELGSGSAIKTRYLIEAFIDRQTELRYVPIDISRSAIEDSSEQLLADYPALDILAVCAEYHQGLEHLGEQRIESKLILWLGSNIGNFSRDAAVAFLQKVSVTMRPGDGLLLGIDLRKDPALLEAAYDDASGVTARFNLNLLARINRELGGHFDLDRFRHVAAYDERAGRVDMFLESKRRQSVRIDDLELDVSFANGERVHTESSYKYSIEEIDELATALGLRPEGRWLDAAARFSSTLLRMP